MYFSFIYLFLLLSSLFDYMIFFIIKCMQYKIKKYTLINQYMLIIFNIYIYIMELI